MLKFEKEHVNCGTPDCCGECNDEHTNVTKRDNVKKVNLKTIEVKTDGK